MSQDLRTADGIREFLSSRFAVEFLATSPDGYADVSRFSGRDGLEPMVFLARKGEEVIGRQAIVPGLVKGPESRIKVALSMGSETDERYRGLGVFPVLVDDCLAYCRSHGIRFVYAFPNEQSLRNFTDHCGFRLMGTVPFLVKPLNARRPFERALGKNLASRGLSSLITGLFRVYRKLCAPRPIGGASISQLLKEPERTEDVWSHAMSERDWMLVRDADFLRWRYATRDYSGYFCEAPRGDALAVGTVEEKLGFRIGFICELMSGGGPDSGRAAARLVYELEDRFLQEGADFSSALFMRGTSAYKALRRAGYIELPLGMFKRNFWVVGIDLEGGQNLYEMDKWAMSLSDIDIV